MKFLTFVVNRNFDQAASARKPLKILRKCWRKVEGLLNFSLVYWIFLRKQLFPNAKILTFRDIPRYPSIFHHSKIGQFHQITLHDFDRAK